MILSAEEFYRLRTSALQGEYERAASEDAPIEVWLEIISSMPEMKEWVAHNKTVPIEILEKLAKDSDSRVRFVVATKRKLPAALQIQLAKDADDGVRDRIARNKNATKSALHVLAKDNQIRIREKAAERLNAGDYIA
jgi:hypothetical protein